MTTEHGLSAAVAATLSGERAAARMSYDDLSAASGIPARSLKRYLSGERDMKLDIIESIAAAMGLTLGEVVTAAVARRDRSDVQTHAARIVAEARAGVDGGTPPPSAIIRPAKPTRGSA